jgi:hypothetical protein
LGSEVRFWFMPEYAVISMLQDDPQYLLDAWRVTQGTAAQRSCVIDWALRSAL